MALNAEAFRYQYDIPVVLGQLERYNIPDYRQIVERLWERDRALEDHIKNILVDNTTGSSTSPGIVIPPWRIGYSIPHGTGWGSLDVTSRDYTQGANYVILASATQTLVNAPSGGDIQLRIANGTQLTTNATSTATTTRFDSPNGGGNGFFFPTGGGGWFMTDTTWIRSHGSKNVWLGGGSYACDGKLSIGYGGGFEFETISIQGGNTGISMVSRNSGDRWVWYPDSSGMNLWLGTDYFKFEDADGRGRFQGGKPWGGRTLLGPWTGSDGYMALCSLAQSESSSTHYLVLGGGTVEADTYQSPNDTNGAIVYRFSDNGSTFASWGINNRTMQNLCTFDVAVPALGGGNTMNLQANGSWQVGYIASTGKVKQNIRALRETPEKDSGHQSPIFKMRPTRFNWKQASKGRQGTWEPDGVANGEELNAKFPNGVVGLIAEEVAQIAPDAVIVQTPIPAEPWDRAKHGLPPTDPDTGEFVTHTRGWEGGITGVDNDRLIAYLIDAVQYLKEEVDELRKVNGRSNPIR